MRATYSRRVLALLLALVCCLPAFSAQGETYPFTAQATAQVSLYQRASASSAVLATIPSGASVLVTGVSGSYYVLIYNSIPGYAAKGSFAPVAATAATARPAAAYTRLYTGCGETDQVKALQTALKALGFYTGAVDGKFGAGTRSAVVAFQKMNGLAQTGVADAADQALLYEGSPKNSQGKAAATATPAPASASLSTGSKGEAVSRLQRRLKELGYYKSTVDGAFGAGTANAVKAFQKKSGLKQTGIADAATQALLYAASAPAANTTATPKPTATPKATASPKADQASFPFTTYTTSSVNLRQKASTSSVRLTTISKGAEISVLAISGDYLKVTYNGKTGFIVAEYAYVPAVYAPGTALAADSDAQQHYPYLSTGSSGRYVTVLQEALKELGFYTGNADGNFGASTAAALKAFQKKNNIKQDGAATPEVQKLIFEGRPYNSRGKRYDVRVLPLFNVEELKLNDKGGQVADLQLRLKSKGYYTGEATGVYDAATQKAVKLFQTEHNLTVDGLAGKKTLKLLYVMTDAPAAEPEITPVPAITPVPTTTPITAKNVIVLRNGTRGQAVTRLQQRLVELGYYSVTPDGLYDSNDIKAVKAFQKNNGLKTDGIAGLQTQLALYADTAVPAVTVTPAPAVITPVPVAAVTATPSGKATYATLRIGDQGELVSALQQRLADLGYYTGKVDGQFGTGTAQAVTRFQRANKLTADGVAGTQTLTKLYASSTAVSTTAKPTAAPAATASAAASVLRMGNQGVAVRDMQRRLVDLGYLASADGDFGIKTFNAVVSFQKRNGLTPDGVVGKMTLTRLNSNSAVAAQSTVNVNSGANNAGTYSAFQAPDPAEVRNANWYTEIRSRAKAMPDVVIYDPETGLHFNLHMFSFGKHADSETPTAADTAVLNQICGENSWTPHYVWVIFTDGRVYIASIHSHGHSVDHTSGNNLEGHICLHFPRVMSEAEATGPYAVSHQKEILWGWELTQARIR